MKFSTLAALLCAATGMTFSGDFNTYIGDSLAYQVNAIAADSAGNTYVAGGKVVQAPPPSTACGGAGCGGEVSLAKLDPSGNLVFTVTLSGRGSQHANGIALDSQGNIFIVGSTTSPDFPQVDPLPGQPAASPTAPAGFLAKFTPDGSLLFSSILGVGGLNAVAVDTEGNAYVTGSTDTNTSLAFPGGSGPPGGNFPAFYAKVSAAGDRVLYSGAFAEKYDATCEGGSECYFSALVTSGVAVAVDDSGNAYIACTTNGGGLAGTPGSVVPNGVGGFVAKLNPDGSLGYLTYLGRGQAEPAGAFPYPVDVVLAIAVDSSGDAYIAGATSNPNFPATPTSYQSSLALPSSLPPNEIPPSDAFVAKLNPSGSAMVWASFLGGTGADSAVFLAADNAGNVWISGRTNSSDFPNASGFPNGQQFLAEFDSSGSRLLYSARLPGYQPPAIAVDASGVLHMASTTGIVSTLSRDHPEEPRIFGVANAAGSADLSGRTAPGELISIYGLHLGPAAPISETFDANGFLPVMVAGIQVSINGVPAPLLYVSDTQINAVSPVELPSSGTLQLTITYSGAALVAMPLALDPAAPEVFRGVLNQDGTVNSASNPAPVGSVLSIWATGLACSFGADGKETTTAQQNCDATISSAVADSPAIPVLYAGPAPGMVTGVEQINFLTPPVSSLQLMSGGKASNSLTVYYR